MGKVLLKGMLDNGPRQLHGDGEMTSSFKLFRIDDSDNVNDYMCGEKGKMMDSCCSATGVQRRILAACPRPHDRGSLG